jgi:hypothetical protein
MALGFGLIGAGLFAVLQAATGRFLPHDERFLGMSAEELCAVQGCRIVHFMIHDRVSFGGSLAAVGMLYLWLAAVPLREGRAWVWWLFLASGTAGFLSFLAYLGYGYLDVWHAVATLCLLPCFVVGLVRSRRALARWEGIGCLLRPALSLSWSSAAGLGRLCLLGTAAGLSVGGLVILVVGMTCVFVPEDVAFLGMGSEELRSLNPRLVPLIAHDRAGFGGAVCCAGLTLLFCVWCAGLGRGLWQVLALVGVAGFGSGIGVHPAVGYVDAVHLAPAVAGALVYAAGLALTSGVSRAKRS